MKVLSIIDGPVDGLRGVAIVFGANSASTQTSPSGDAVADGGAAEERESRCDSEREHRYSKNSDAAEKDEREPSALASRTAGGLSLGSGRCSGVSAAALEHCRTHVVLRIECETASETRRIIGTLQALVCVGVVILFVELALKIRGDNSNWFDKRYFAIMNVCLSSICLMFMISSLAIFSWHLWIVRQQQWTKRRIRLCAPYFALLVIQIVNAMFWLIPNAALISSACFIFASLTDTAGFIRWTCWNSSFCIFSVMAHCMVPITSRRWPWRRNRDGGGGGSPPRSVEPTTASFEDTITSTGRSIVLDASLWNHWPSGIAWCVLQGILCWSRAINDRLKKSAPCSEFITICHTQGNSKVTDITTQLIGAMIGVYAVLIGIYYCKTFRALKDSPYNEYRVANIVSTLQARTTIRAIIFLIVGTACLWFSNTGKCSNYLQTWMGLGPNQVVMAALVVTLASFFMPRTTSNAGLVVKVLLRDVAWTEGARDSKRAERAAFREYHTEGDLVGEPLFCFETALKAFHWSFLSYRYEEHAGADATTANVNDPNALEGDMPIDPGVEVALKMLDLSGIEIMREHTYDTKLLFGTGRRAMLLAFRGTASRRGCGADLQVLLSRHPRQHSSSMWPALVHKGFLSAWMTGGLRERVLGRVREHLTAAGTDAADMRILVTGHSLGGALASLAAYDIAAEFRGDFGLRQIECVTIGAPRVGNSTFVGDYNRHVPETWHIINDNDAITRVGKFWVFKRAGQRVIINPLGDLIVRPTPLEQRLQAWSQPTNHLLSAYGKSIMVILAAQFTPKGIAGGAEGVLDMIRGSEPIRSILESGGFVLDRILRDTGYMLEDGDDGGSSVFRGRGASKQRCRLKLENMTWAREGSGDKRGESFQGGMHLPCATEAEVAIKEPGWHCHHVAKK